MVVYVRSGESELSRVDPWVGGHWGDGTLQGLSAQIKSPLN